MTPKVAIILINWNNFPDTAECLKSLQSIDRHNFEPYIIVVDNGSEKTEADLVRKTGEMYPYEFIGNDTNKGYVVASNMAIAKAYSDPKIGYILQLDNDTVVRPDTISKMVELAESDTNIGVVGAKIFYYNDPTRLQWVGESLNFWVGEVTGLTQSFKRIFSKESIVTDKYNKVRDVDFIVSWCSLTRRQVYEKVGLLDESFFFGWEDNDFCLRARKAGFRLVWTPEATLLHKYSSANALDGHLQYHGPKTRFKFMRKHATKPQLISFYLYYALVHFWLATAYYLLWVRKPKIYLRFLRGTAEGALNL
jgi:GT2 family glycosyltransferase